MHQTTRKYRKRTKPLLTFTSSIPWKPRGKDDPMMVGYVRVSMSHQNTQRQVDDLVKAGVAPVDIFGDTASGRDMERPGWKACVRDLQSGDILVIHSLDRLSRDLVDTMLTLRKLADSGVRLKVLTLDFDSQTPMGRFVFAMMSAFAQFEREVINQRAAHGLQSARERGIIGGRSRTYKTSVLRAAYKEHGTYDDAAKALGCSRITLIRRLAPKRVARREEKKFQKQLADQAA
jgi:DNA invertase Pin-like site-specific DNA recombinase